MLREAAVTPSPERLAAIETAWANLVGAGPTLNGSERRHVISAARSAWAGGAAPAAHPMAEAAHWSAVDAGGLSAEVVADFEVRGLDRFRYLEVVGVVARLANIDFYVRGIGAAPLELPPDDGFSPTGNVLAADARIVHDWGWVPSLGRVSAPGWLDVFPDEAAALLDMHEAMYVTMAVIGDGAHADVLTKAQIEFIAARTSYLNECFY